MNQIFQSDWKDRFLNFIASLCVQLGIWIFIGLIALTMIYGQFPPPFEKIKNNLSHFQEAMRGSGNVEQLAKLEGTKKRLEQTLELADTHREESAQMANGESSKESSRSSAYEAQIKILSYKVQTLEARQEAMTAEIAKLKTFEKTPQPAINK